MRRCLNFSNEFFNAEYIENIKLLDVKNYGIVTNLDKDPIIFDQYGSIDRYKSYLLKNWQIVGQIKKAILVTFGYDPIRQNPKLNQFCIEHWDNNKIRYPNDPSKWKFKILRSPIEKFGNLEFNCWYLPKNTASSIHIEHPFKEVHTQLYGLGIMNKFKEQKHETLYQKMYMAPGFTHDLFFDKQVIYPWHQYEAVTESVWMAIMDHKQP